MSGSRHSVLSNTLAILNCLSDGLLHPFSELSEVSGLSRRNVRRHLIAIEQAGFALEIDRHEGRCYYYQLVNPQPARRLLAKRTEGLASPMKHSRCKRLNTSLNFYERRSA